jgi:Uncharacterized conserved protein
MIQQYLETSGKVPIGISSCLLGAEVRFDGGHKWDNYVNTVLSYYFEFVPICPEVAIGMGVPREPIHLVGDPSDPRAVGVRNSRLDVTGALQAFGRNLAPTLANLSGYILKSASPSCGMQGVRIHTHEGVPHASGPGIYAKALMEALPLLPLEEEDRLRDPVLRENFIERVFVYHRWQALIRS